MVAGGAAADEVKNDRDFTLLTRRRIYFNRLVGDFDMGPKSSIRRRTPARVVLRFIFYAAVATIFIIGRSDVEVQSSMNMALTKAFKMYPYAGGPVPEYFDDIESVEDVHEWLSYAILPQLFQREPLSEPFSFLAHNRVMPAYPTNGTDPSIQITLRRMKMESPSDEWMDSDTAGRHTKRFTKLYPETWLGENILAGSVQGDAEYTQVLTGTYRNSDTSRAPLPPGRGGKEEAAGNVVSGTSGTLGTDVSVEWAHSGPDARVGSKDAGGYVATLSLALTPSQRSLLNSPATDAHAVAQNIVLDQLVTLTAPKDAAPAMGLPQNSDGTLPNVIRLGDFFTAGFADRRTASMSLEFLIYNANLQTMTKVSANFAWNSAGSISVRELLIVTLALDIHHEIFGVIPFFWLLVIYAIFTAGYLIQLLLQLYKYGRNGAFFRSFWSYCNFISILSSVLSLGYWVQYQSAHQEKVLGVPGGTPPVIHISFIDDRIHAFQWFSRLSSFATLTIFLRVLQFLSDTTPRVKLLLRTMGLAMHNMVIYISFIGVIFAGFTTFAMTHFSLFDLDFAHYPSTTVSNFALFMGDIKVLDKGSNNASLASIYLVVFMTIFFLVSVQMFNAIINYSYNKASEDMEPQFEKERHEKKRKQLSRRASPSMFEQVVNCLRVIKGSRKRDEDKEGQKDEPAAADKKVPTGLGLSSLDALDPVTKEKVEKYLHRGLDQKPVDGPMAMLAFMCFAISYVLFLHLNLNIGANYTLGSSIRRVLEETGIQKLHPDGSTTLFNMGEVYSVPELHVWITEVLPLMVHRAVPLPFQINGTLRTGRPILHPEQKCMNHFNYFVPGLETGRKCKDNEVQCKSCPKTNTVDLAGTAAQNPSKIMRITSREIRRKVNDGEKMPRTPTTPGNRFVLGKEYLPMRGMHEPIHPDEGYPQDRENIDDVSKWQINSQQFCKRVALGSGGHRGNGGLECLLDEHAESFKMQTRLFSQETFISRETSSIAVEFVIHNGHLDMLYSGYLNFLVLPSGLIVKPNNSISFLIMDITKVGEFETLVRLMFGVLYIIFVVYFASKFWNDLGRALRRKSLEKKSYLSTIIAHLTQDIFNLLDAASITLSVVASCLFISWVLAQSRMKCELRGPHSDFVTYVHDIARQAKLYNQISSLNMLVIFIRPLQFFRESPRMAQLMHTISGSVEDISWFVVMLFITMVGFVMMAYVSFGAGVEGLSTLPKACIYCFYYILGNFDFHALAKVDSLMAIIFFFPYLLLFYCVFQNLFFAIIDRNFVTANPPAENWRKKLKPLFGKLCWCIEWDEDYQMDENPSANPKEGPPSRSDRVHKTMMKIQDLEDQFGVTSGGTISKKAKQLSDVCDMDDRLTEVLHWSRDEAKKFVDKYQSLLTRKQENKSNDENFIKNEVMTEVRKEANDAKKDMDDEQRKMIYAIQVHESMAMRDQEMLSRYILLLEDKIKKKIGLKFGLRQEVNHLRLESERMRYTDEEQAKRQNDEMGMHRQAQRLQAPAVSDTKAGGGGASGSGGGGAQGGAQGGALALGDVAAATAGASIAGAEAEEEQKALAAGGASQTQTQARGQQSSVVVHVPPPPVEAANLDPDGVRTAKKAKGMSLLDALGDD